MGILDYRHEDPHRFWDHMGRAIELAFLPWNPGRVVCEMRLHLSMADELWLQVELFPETPFVFKIDPFDRRRADPELYNMIIAEEAFKFYRNRPSLPVDDHIILGEE